MKRLQRLLMVALPLALVSAAEPPPRRQVIEIRNFKFVPAEVRVARGDTVVWVNRDALPHTATAVDDNWDSGNIAAGAAGQWVASVAGEHPYICAYHQAMKGNVLVR